MGSQGRTGRPDRRYPVAVPARGAERTRRQTVPDLESQGKSRTVSILRTVPRRSRLQGASRERAFQDLHRGPSAAAAGQTRARAIRVAVIDVPGIASFESAHYFEPKTLLSSSAARSGLWPAG